MANDARAAARKRLQEDIDMRLAAPPPPHVRNINLDTHLGHAPQRPYAAVEDLMGQLNNGWGNYDLMREALPDGEEIEELPDGTFVRYVPVIEGVEEDRRTGQREALVSDEAHVVTLTREDARDMASRGIRADYFDGFTWWRDGRKPEKDYFVAEHQAAQENRRRVPLGPDGSIDFSRPSKSSRGKSGGRGERPERSEPRADAEGQGRGQERGVVAPPAKKEGGE